MSVGNFQLIDKESIDTSVIERDYMKKYQQQRAQLKDFNQSTGLLVSFLVKVALIFK